MNDTTKVPAILQAALTAQNIDTTKCNLMLPTKTYGDVLGMFNKITFESITVNPDLKGGDVYEPNGKGKGKAFTKVPLQRIAIALGIKWDPVTTGTVEDTGYFPSHPELPCRSRSKATGALRKPNGDWLPITDEKTIDVDALTERDMLAIEEKAEKGNPDVVTKWGKEDGHSFPVEFKKWKDDAEMQRYLDRKRRSIRNSYALKRNELANTGAHERVIRAFIAMKSTYTDEELAKDFVYPCVMLDPEKMLATPELQAAALKNFDPSVRAIFGPGLRDVTPPKQIESIPVTRTVDVDSGETIQQPPAGELFDLADDVEPPVEKTPLEKARETLEGYKETFKKSSKALKLINHVLDKEDPDATLDEVNSAIDQLVAELQRRKAGTT